MPQIPIDRSKGLVTFSQLLTLAKEFKVDRKVYRLFSDNGRDVIKLIKPIIAKYATDSSGNFRTNWKLLSSSRRAALVRYDMRRSLGWRGFSRGNGPRIWSLRN